MPHTLTCTTMTQHKLRVMMTARACTEQAHGVHIPALPGVSSGSSCLAVDVLTSDPPLLRDRTPCIWHALLG